MSLLIWNVRGFNKKGRSKDVMDHFHKHSPSVLALVETQVKLAKVMRLNGCVHHWWSCHHFHLSRRGRIWIAWGTSIWTCFPVSVSLQQITLYVTNRGGLEGHLTIVYGENTHGQREQLWKEHTATNYQLALDCIRRLEHCHIYW